jgi:hypothetical protein
MLLIMTEYFKYKRLSFQILDEAFADWNCDLRAEMRK